MITIILMWTYVHPISVESKLLTVHKENGGRSSVVRESEFKSKGKKNQNTQEVKKNAF